MSNNVQVLSQVPLFSNIGQKQLERLSELSVPKNYDKDAVIMSEGTQGLGMFIITKGEVEVYKEEGGRKSRMATNGEGSVIGEMALIDDHYRSASVRALEPTECLLITRDAFNTLVKQEPKIAMSVMSVLAERVRSANKRVMELEGRSSETGGDRQERPRDDQHRTRSDDQAETKTRQVRYEEETVTADEGRRRRRTRTEYETSTGSHEGHAGIHAGQAAGASVGDAKRQLIDMQREMVRMSADFFSNMIGMVSSLGGSIAGESKRAARQGMTEMVTSLATATNRASAGAGGGDYEYREEVHYSNRDRGDRDRGDRDRHERTRETEYRREVRD